MPRYTLQPIDTATWDTLVKNSPHSTIFHTSWWLSATGFDFHLLGVFKGTQLVAGIPLTFYHKFGLKLLIHPPLTPYLGPLFIPTSSKYVEHKSTELAILTLIATHLSRISPFIIQRFAPYFDNILPFLQHHYSPYITYTYILKLNTPHLLTHLRTTRRNDITYAKSHGLTVTHGTRSDLLSLYTHTMHRHSHRPYIHHLRRYYEYAHSRDSATILTAYDRHHVPQSVALIVWDHHRAYYLAGGFSPSSVRGATSLLLWECIQFCQHRGLSEFDFEGSMLPTIEHFFRSFGGTLTPIFGIQKLRPPLNLLWSIKRKLHP